MPKPRRPVLGSSLNGGPPVELLDKGHPLWQSRTKTKAWLDDHDLKIGAALEWGPLNRHKSSMFAWAKRAGLMKPAMANGFIGYDYVAMRALGLPAEGGSGPRHEQLESLGVMTFDDSWRK